MSRAAEISPTHSVIKTYYRDLKEIHAQGVANELSTRSPFFNLLSDTARLHGWTTVAEMTMKSGGRNLRPDATLRDRNNFPRGYWEAKDSADDLEAEIRKKSDLKYPLTNIIFEDTERGILYQNKERVFTANLGDPRELADLLNRFYGHEEPDIEAFDLALEEFQQRVPDLANGLQAKIADAHSRNRQFQEAWSTFFSL